MNAARGGFMRPILAVVIKARGDALLVAMASTLKFRRLETLGATAVCPLGMDGEDAEPPISLLEQQAP